MKRSECTKESLQKKGYKTCYSEESGYEVRYTYDEVVKAIQSGATVEKEISIVCKRVYFNVDGKSMLVRPATDEEYQEEVQAKRQKQREEALKRIHNRNIVKMRRH